MRKLFYIVAFVLAIDISCSEDKKEEIPVNHSLIGYWELHNSDDNDDVTEYIKVKFDTGGWGEWTNHRPALFSRNPQADVTYNFFYVLNIAFLP